MNSTHTQASHSADAGVINTLRPTVRKPSRSDFYETAVFASDNTLVPQDIWTVLVPTDSIKNEKELKKALKSHGMQPTQIFNKARYEQALESYRAVANEEREQIRSSLIDNAFQAAGCENTDKRVEKALRALLPNMRHVESDVIAETFTGIVKLCSSVSPAH